MFVDHVLELDDRLGFLPELQERVSLLQERRRRLVALGEVLQQAIEVGDRLVVLLLSVVGFADPVLRVVGEVGRRIRLKVLLEALDRERVAPAAGRTTASVGVGRPGFPEGSPIRGDAGFAVDGGAPGMPVAGGTEEVLPRIRERSPCVSAICWESCESRRLVSSSFACSCSIAVESSPSFTPVSAFDFSSCWASAAEALDFLLSSSQPCFASFKSDFRPSSGAALMPCSSKAIAGSKL